jgi:hypothetical protein
VSEVAPTVTVTVTCVAWAAQAPPNIDFYVLLDNSPSMALPATTAGITKMQSLTTQEESPGGCAFACHHVSTNANTDTKGNPCVDGTMPTLSAPRPRRQKATPIARPSTADRSIITSSPATTASRFVWTN